MVFCAPRVGHEKDQVLAPVWPCLKRTRPHSALELGSQHAHTDLLYDLPDSVSDILIGHGEQLCAEKNDLTKPPD
jgi:hypothetical protein